MPENGKINNGCLVQSQSILIGSIATLHGINMVLCICRIRFCIALSFYLVFSSSLVFSYTIFDQRNKQLLVKASAGDKRAQYKLGVAYMTGTSVKFNRAKAIQWFKKAAAQSYRKAWYRLGELHYEKRYRMRNYSSSFKWFLKAAEKNHGISQYYVALQYYKGRGVSQKYSKALAWATRARKNGVDEAADLLQKINSNIPPTLAVKPKVKSRVKPKVQPATNSKAKPELKIASKTSRKPQTEGPRKVSKLDVRKLLYVGSWNQNGKPSDYVPSISNQCINLNQKIRCTSRRIRDRRNQYTADFRIVSLITNFQPKGEFTIRYRKKYVMVTRDDPKQKIAVPGLGLGDHVLKLKCRILGKDHINCEKPDHSVVQFTKK